MTAPVLGNVAADHPAKWSSPVVLAMAELVDAERERRGHQLAVLDPFAGIGRGRLADALRPNASEVIGVELQAEWCVDELTICGSACWLPGRNGRGTEDWTGRFHCVCTSPCMEQGHRILTDDLRWVPAGDVEVGQAVLAFDETAGSGRRRWQRAEVVRSVPRSVECLRVILANGDQIVTTPEHPWLASRYAYGSRPAEWVTSANLAGVGALGAGKEHRRGARLPYWVQRQVEPWLPRTTYDAGWLAGMFDGEGSLSLGVHGSPKLTLCQVEGAVVDRAERLMADFGYSPNRIPRTKTPAHRQQVVNLYVTDGFPGLLRALGELRPTRLLAKWETLDISTRTVQADKVEVVAVERAGRRDIQEIETTAGTYFGEGYMMHNCYGNRCADHHQAADPCKACKGTGAAPRLQPEALGRPCDTCKGQGLSWRNTYAHALRRHGADLVPGSAAGMQWGPEYRALHRVALAEMLRVLVEGGLLAINMSNHLRTLIGGGPQVEQLVVEWWLNEVILAGCRIQEVRRVRTSRNGKGANGQARVDGEVIIVAHTPSPRRTQGVLL